MSTHIKMLSLCLGRKNGKLYKVAPTSTSSPSRLAGSLSNHCYLLGVQNDYLEAVSCGSFIDIFAPPNWRLLFLLKLWNQNQDAGAHKIATTTFNPASNRIGK